MSNMTITIHQLLQNSSPPQTLLVNTCLGYYSIYYQIWLHIKRTFVDQHANFYQIDMDRVSAADELLNILSSQDLFVNHTVIELTCKKLKSNQELLKIINQPISNDVYLIMLFDVPMKEFNKIRDSLPNFHVLTRSNSDLHVIARYKCNLYGVPVDNAAIKNIVEFSFNDYIEFIRRLDEWLFAKNVNNMGNCSYDIYQLSRAYMASDKVNAVNIANRMLEKHEDAVLINWIMWQDLNKLIKVRMKPDLYQFIDKVANIDLMIKGFAACSFTCIRSHIINLIIQLCQIHWN
jgi:hypothetical protein